MIRSPEELRTIRESIQRTMRPFDPDYWRRLDAQRGFPEEVFRRVAEAGYFGTLIDSAYGGSDAGPTVASVVVEEINRAGGDATAINAQMTICGTLARDGTDEQKAKYLPGIATGDVRCISVAATEPDSGSDMSSLASTARRDGSDWILDAQKIFISLAEHTRLIFVLANTTDGSTLFLVDREDVGSELELRPLELITNRLTTTLFIDGLRLPDSARLGPLGQGAKCLQKGFAQRRVLAASEALGNARYLLDLAVEQAKTRKAFDKIIGENQGVQYPITQAHLHVEAAALMRDKALEDLEAGLDAGPRSAMAKILASEAAWEAVRATMTAFGGWALSSEMHIERKLRESTVFIFNNMLLSYVAQRVLGLPKGF